jgi:ATP-dependent RNA helicase DeaD
MDTLHPDTETGNDTSVSAPDDRDASDGAPAQLSFADLALLPALTRSAAELGYESPTPIQAQCIPPLLAGRDLLGQAQTGTGKTAAFALPCLNTLDPDLRTPQVLVLTPTRELALQVAEAFQLYGRYLPRFHVVPIYGGQSYTLQIRQLKHNPQVIVGTPGRIMDHIRRGTLSFAELRVLVLDEADEMLNMGFAEDIDWIFDHTPDGRQVALFSATMPQAIRKIAHGRLKDPVEISVRGQSETVDTIEQQHCIVTRFHKIDVLTRILELEPFDGMVIFVRTKNATVELADTLKAHGFTAEPLNGDMSQEMRERTVERLKRGALDIVVATDVAARGLDVERVSHVVNYDIPSDPQAYIHRIGRTGRAGRTGKAILLVEPRERGLLRAIERTIRRPVPQMEPPSAEALSSSRIDRFVADMRKTLSGEELDFFYRLISNIAREQELEPMDIAAALAFQLQQDRPLEVEELPPPPRRAGPPDRQSRGPRDGGDQRRRFRADQDGEGRPPRGRSSEGLERYRIEVGHAHAVTPREIVGAIANEAGLEGRYIGRIDIQDDHSIVELPSGMPKEIFQHLKRVYVRGQALRISNAGGPGGSPPSGAPRGHSAHRPSGEGGARPGGGSGRPPNRDRVRDGDRGKPPGRGPRPTERSDARPSGKPPGKRKPRD